VHCGSGKLQAAEPVLSEQLQLEVVSLSLTALAVPVTHWPTAVLLHCGGGGQAAVAAHE
jgi:hypothetical protein